MKNLISLISNKPHHSFYIICDKTSKEPIKEYLKSNVPVLEIEIEETIKKSFLKFLSSKNIKHPKTAPSYVLADKIASYAREKGKHILINIKSEYLNDKEIKSLAKALWIIYNSLTQNPAFSPYVYYPLVTGQESIFRELRKEEGMWRYKLYFPKGNFKVNVGLWIEDYECYKCKKPISVLVGLRVGDEVYCITDLKEEAIKFIQDKFPEEFNRLNIKKEKSYFSGYISNICPYCNSRIGNFYLFDEIYVEQMPFNFEDVKTAKKEVEFDEVKNILERL